MRGPSFWSYLLAGALGFLLWPAKGGVCENTAPSERLRAAELLSSLDSADLKPWHLKMSVQLFDVEGKAKDQGTIEEWWGGPGMEKRSYSTRAYTATEMFSNGRVYRTKGMDLPPYYLDLLRRQIVHPMPSQQDVNGANPVLRKQSFGKVPVECVVLQPAEQRDPSSGRGSYPTYCFEAGKASLRITMDFGSHQRLRNNFGQFQGREIPVDVVIGAEGKTAATGHVETLAVETLPASDFLPAADVVEVPRVVQVHQTSSFRERGTYLPYPNYPPIAKAKHVSGAVVMRAIIATDGHVRDLQVLSSPDADLTKSALEAVRNWVYKPYLLNGEAMEVDTVITCHFTFGG